MNRPIIGITTNLGEKGAELARGYWQSIRRAGGVPMLLAPTDDEDEQEEQLLQLDGLLLSGGGDINPLLMGQDPEPELHSICPERDAYELRLCRRAHDKQIPVMGICRGAQVMAVALGGEVCQDIERWKRKHGEELTIKHSQDAPRDCATHIIYIKPDDAAKLDDESKQETALPFKTKLATLLKTDKIAVNSFHHQAVTAPGPHMTVAARSADGVIEALQEREGESFLLAVQWHPECMKEMAPLFDLLIDEARNYGEALELHHRIQTLDSHCDTPMFFDQLINQSQQSPTPSSASPLNLQQRNDTVLVDAEKMNDGHLDETFMVAYIPQGPLTDEGYDDAHRQVLQTFSRLDEMIAATDDFIQAPVGKYADVDTDGRLVIHRGIENGYPIGPHPERIMLYKSLGCEYITLCHNGHNHICDSARPLKAGTRCEGSYPATDEALESFGGLSDYGKIIVSEMNKAGMLIDLSHASEKSFYDVLRLSSKPVAVTHACCRAICDHPRNLNDDQLRAIAENDGVVQCTMYAGFLSEGSPTISDFMRHLTHMIEVADIDHVGIGSDFDGDGGVPGLDHAGCMINITRLLLQEGYSEDDICKLWGDNFRRVLAAQR